VLNRARARPHAYALEPPAQACPRTTPGALTPELEAALAAQALLAFSALRCRDFARVDFKQDASGRPRFLELNTLPTFAPDASFGILAELMGRPLPDLLAEVLRGGLTRLGLA
jgi:D-alanine-D-alanine ligase